MFYYYQCRGNTSYYSWWMRDTQWTILHITCGEGRGTVCRGKG